MPESTLCRTLRGMVEARHPRAIVVLCFLSLLWFALVLHLLRGLFFSHSEHAEDRVGYQNFTVDRLLVESLSRRSQTLYALACATPLSQICRI